MVSKHSEKGLLLLGLAEQLLTSVKARPFSEYEPDYQIFVAVWELEAQLHDGGFDAFLSFSVEELVVAAPGALRTLGAERSALLVERAFQILQPWPGSLEARQDRIVNLKEGIFDGLDEEFLSDQDKLTDRLFDFVAERPAIFGPVAATP